MKLIVVTCILSRIVNCSNELTCEKACTGEATCIKKFNSHCRPLENSLTVGTCHMFYYNSLNKICFNSGSASEDKDCPRTSPVYCNLRKPERPIFDYKAGGAQVTIKQDSSCRCKNIDDRRFCIDETPNDCSNICNETPGCSSGGSFCLSWEENPRCFGLYWVGEEQTCYSIGNKHCPTYNPVYCTHVTTTVKSVTLGEIAQEDEGEESVIPQGRYCARVENIFAVVIVKPKSLFDLTARGKFQLSLTDVSYSVNGNKVEVKRTKEIKALISKHSMVEPLLSQLKYEGGEFSALFLKITPKGCTKEFDQKWSSAKKN